MKICPKCNFELENDTMFCTNCGANLSATDNSVSSNAVTPKKEFTNNEANDSSTSNEQMAPDVATNAPIDKTIENNKTNSKPIISKSQIMVAGIIAAVIVIVIVVYGVGNSVLGKKSQIANFSKALESNDASAVEKYLSTSDSNLKIDTESTKSLLTYLDNNKGRRDSLIASIKEDDSSTNLVKLQKKVIFFLYLTNILFKLHRHILL